MTDNHTAIRSAGGARLPELSANNEELSGLIQSLLSPAVVAALSAQPGPAATGSAIPETESVTTRATALLRDLDSQLPALRAAPISEAVL